MIAALLLLTLLAGPAAAAEPVPGPKTMDLVALDGSPLPKDTLTGKVVLFVNVASRCGFTPQYKGLQALYEARKDEGLVVVGVPCNQFGAQEPGSAEQIATFCERNYGVTFPLLHKQDVNGPKRSPLYTSLVGEGADIKWNFEKFLVGRDGAVLGRFDSGKEPEGPEIKAALDSALKQ
jgi:glutathione peroxidase-family protein